MYRERVVILQQNRFWVSLEISILWSWIQKSCSSACLYVRGPIVQNANPHFGKIHTKYVVLANHVQDIILEFFEKLILFWQNKSQKLVLIVYK